MGHTVLGLGGLDHNGSIAVVVDGVVDRFIEAERVTRHKDIGLIDWATVTACLDALNVSSVDRIAVADRTFWKRCQPWLEPALAHRFPGVPIHVWLHHECHAVAAIAGSGFDEALAITVDGKGDGLSAAGYRMGSDGLLDPLLRVPSATSIGRLWWAVSEWCGFHGFHGAGKVMALAAFGEPKGVWDRYLTLQTNGEFRLDPRGLHPDTFREVPRIVEWLTDTMGPATEASQADVAASVQALTERVVVHLVGSLVERTGIRDVCLAGGVALNGLANQCLFDEGVVDHLFVPSCTDDRGLSLGAAVIEAWHAVGRTAGRAVASPFLGPELLTDEPAPPWRRTRGRTMVDVAAHLAAGRIVAVCRGRDEAGPRALGHRSLLASPTVPGMQDRLNREVKHREPFRPFGIAIARGAVADWVELDGDSPYMLRIAQVRETARARIPAAVHVDGSTRVQTVEPSDGSGLAELLDELVRAGHPPIVLNTSLNRRGEPLVHTVAQAAESAKEMGVHLLLTDSGLYELPW